MEKQFFFRNHMNMSREEFLDYPIWEREWMIARFQKQQELEQAAAEKAAAKAKSSKKSTKKG